MKTNETKNGCLTSEQNEAAKAAYSAMVAQDESFGASLLSAVFGAAKFVAIVIAIGILIGWLVR